MFSKPGRLGRAEKTLKLVVVGDPQVGKTSLLKTYVEGKFTGNYKATIGTDTVSKRLRVMDTVVDLQIWDTAGQERFRALNRAYYRGAHAVILVYDISQKKTFGSLSYWLEDFLDKGNPDGSKFPVIVVGNKLDLAPHNRNVALEEAISWCNARKAAHFEASAKEQYGVEKLFLLAAERAVEYEKRSSKPATHTPAPAAPRPHSRTGSATGWLPQSWTYGYGAAPAATAGEGYPPASTSPLPWVAPGVGGGYHSRADSRISLYDAYYEAEPQTISYTCC